MDRFRTAHSNLKKIDPFLARPRSLLMACTLQNDPSKPKEKISINPDRATPWLFWLRLTVEIARQRIFWLDSR